MVRDRGTPGWPAEATSSRCSSLTQLDRPCRNSQANNSPSWDLALEMKAMCHLWQPTGFTGGARELGQPEREIDCRACGSQSEAGTQSLQTLGLAPSGLPLSLLLVAPMDEPPGVRTYLPPLTRLLRSRSVGQGYLPCSRLL